MIIYLVMLLSPPLRKLVLSLVDFRRVARCILGYLGEREYFFTYTWKPVLVPFIETRGGRTLAVLQLHRSGEMTTMAVQSQCDPYWLGYSADVAASPCAWFCCHHAQSRIMPRQAATERGHLYYKGYTARLPNPHHWPADSTGSHFPSSQATMNINNLVPRVGRKQPQKATGMCTNYYVIMAACLV